MRIPFLRKREKSPVLYKKGIEDEYELNRKARMYTTELLMGLPPLTDYWTLFSNKSLSHTV